MNKLCKSIRIVCSPFDNMSLASIIAALDLGFVLKKKQELCLEALVDGKNLFPVLPTGYGKSLIYSLFPLIKAKMNGNHQTALVVSPLISLRADQCLQLREMGITASAINSQSTQDEIDDVLKRKCQIIFISPEKMMEDEWFLLFTRGPIHEDICLLCFDEAHCISQWGLEFRNTYRELCCLSAAFIDIPLITSTATCTKEMKEDLFQQLGFGEDTCIINEVSDRPNIFLGATTCPEDLTQLNWIIEEIKDKRINSPKFLIYCRNIQSCSMLFFWAMEELGEDLFLDGDRKVGNRVIDMFHSGTDSKSKSRILETFSKSKSPLKVIFSTVSFGLGIQISDVSFVIRWGVENSMLTYRPLFARSFKYDLDLISITADRGGGKTWRRAKRQLVSILLQMSGNING